MSTIFWNSLRKSRVKTDSTERFSRKDSAFDYIVKRFGSRTVVMKVDNSKAEVVKTKDLSFAELKVFKQRLEGKGFLIV